MQFKLHQTNHTIGDFDNIFDYIKNLDLSEGSSTIHLFPELFLTGYPLQDLVLQKQFYSRYLEFLEQLKEWSLSLATNQNQMLLIGGLDYQMDQSNLPWCIKNVIFQIYPGKEPLIVYTKRLLPNYDIFDEMKYFTAGDETVILSFNNKNIALMICEDMWPSSIYKIDPVVALKEYADRSNNKIDHIVNLSASPFHISKLQKRVKRAIEISNYLNAPFYYVNRVGAEDEILFDGASFAVSNGKLVASAKQFEPDCLILDELQHSLPTNENSGPSTIGNTWESLFSPRIIDIPNAIPQLTPLTDYDCEEILYALKLGIQQYADKCGLNKFNVALSGGMDSALVLTIMKMVLKPNQQLEAIYMPGFFSATKSFDLSANLCQKINVPLKSLPIKFFHSSIRNAFKDCFHQELDGLADENIQSRLRGALLYARSNQSETMVLNTSNKSEIAVGYSTQYGDSVGALSVLGDLYKTEVYQLANYINRKFNDVIPKEIISRAPSAELRENQEDQQSLPPYDRLDAILEGILSYRHDTKELINFGFNPEEVKKVFKLYVSSEYKRAQFCPIIKLKSKSFGFGYRVPICKRLNY